MEHVPSTDGISRYHRDNGFGAGSHLALEIQHIEAVASRVIDISGLAPDFLVAARAEGFLALPRQDDDSDVGIKSRIGKRLRHLIDSQRPERVAPFRAVDGDFCNAFRLFVADVRKGAGAAPGDAGHRCLSCIYGCCGSCAAVPHSSSSHFRKSVV